MNARGCRITASEESDQVDKNGHALPSQAVRRARYKVQELRVSMIFQIALSQLRSEVVDVPTRRDERV